MACTAPASTLDRWRGGGSDSSTNNTPTRVPAFCSCFLLTITLQDPCFVYPTFSRIFCQPTLAICFRYNFEPRYPVTINAFQQGSRVELDDRSLDAAPR